MIHPTEFITFPRSGHHLLIDLLKYYFASANHVEESLYYCEMYKDPEKRFENCVLTNAQKNHDFELSTAIVPGRRYIVQIRDPLESIASYCEYQWTHGAAMPDREKFLKNTLDYWARFTAKWIYSPVPERLIVHYRELIDRPIPTLASVVNHMTGNFVILEKLREAAEITGVRTYVGLRK